MITWNKEKAREYYQKTMKGWLTEEQIDAWVEWLFRRVDDS